MAEFYHIYIDAPGLAPDNRELKKKLDLAVDWFRYADNCWLVYTTSDASKWYQRLGELVKSRNGNLLIIKVDQSERQGWISKKLWEWIREKT